MSKATNRTTPPAARRSRPTTAAPGQLYTSNFASLKSLAAAGIEPIAISIGIPRWYTASGRRVESRLAPTRAMLDLPTWKQYDDRYLKILDRLDPQEILDSLTRRGTRNIAMLCWCARRGAICHRRYAAEWLEAHLGIVVPEFAIDRSETETFFDWE